MKGEGNLPFFLFLNTVYLYSMKEMVDYFLNKPINDSYIKRVAFEYFNSDFQVAQEFLIYLQKQNIEQKN